MRRKFLFASIVLVRLIANPVRIHHHKLGWGGYWSLDIVAPWNR
jgi:hypothetical protein